MGNRGEIEKQNHARDLPAQGWTLTEICEAVGCSKSSASLWCREVEVDEAMLDARLRARHLAGNEGARRRGPNKLQQRKAAEIDELQAAGRARIGELSGRDQLIAGLALYAGEGGQDRRRRQVRQQRPTDDQVLRALAAKVLRHR